MVLAGQTTVSPAATWAIVIVAVIALAVWLSAVYLADRSQARASGRARPETWPAYAGPWARAGAAGDQATQIPQQAVREPTGAQGRHARDEPAAEDETPTRPDIPDQAGPESGQPGAAPGRHRMPTQRTGDADQAERSRAGQGTPEQEDPGR